MNFYTIDAKSIGGPEYAWASGYGPNAEDIDDIPFLKESPEVMKRNLRDFWEVSKRGPGIKLDTWGKKWPDVLGCGQGSPSFFASQKIVEDLRNTGVSLLRLTEMPLAPPLPKKLRDVPPPRYYVLEGIPGLEVAWSAMKIPSDGANKIDFSKGYPKPWPPVEWKVSLSSWSGFDLVSYINWQLPMTLVCTDKIRDLAKARNWTNIAFRPLVTVG
jgi:hypothetical protein